MRALVCFVCGSMLVAGLLCLTAVAVESEQTADTQAKEEKVSESKPVATPLTMNQRLINSINKYRAKYKQPPLHENPILMKVAAERVRHLNANLGGMNHHVCGCWAREHCHREGFVGPCQDVCAELHRSPEDAVNSWGYFEDHQGIKGHNYALRGFENINNRNYQQHYDSVGVSISGGNYIAILGRDDSVK